MIKIRIMMSTQGLLISKAMISMKQFHGWLSQWIEREFVETEACE